MKDLLLDLEDLGYVHTESVCNKSKDVFYNEKNESVVVIDDSGIIKISGHSEECKRVHAALESSGWSEYFCIKEMVRH